MDVADGYVTFMRHSQDMLREKVNEEVYIERLFDVSKMPSPLLKKGGAFQNVVKQQGREGWVPFSDQEVYFSLAEEAFYPLHLSVCFSSL